VTIALVVVCVLLWYGLRGLGVWWAPAGRLVGRLSPWTRKAHAWVLSAPATFAYITVFTASTAVQRSAPPRLIDLLTRMQSTNIHDLDRAPLTALAESGLWVADKGAGLGGYVLAFATVVAWAERRYGTPRIIVICLSGHVFGTLLTVWVERAAISSGRASRALANTTDVGVSYMMVAGLVAAVILLPGWWRWAAGSALTLGVLGPVVVDHTLWDLGHLFATLCGLVTAVFTLLLVPARTPPVLEPCLARSGPQERGGPGGEGGEPVADVAAGGLPSE
jgi:hypothetical protein